MEKNIFYSLVMLVQEMEWVWILLMIRQRLIRYPEGSAERLVLEALHDAVQKNGLMIRDQMEDSLQRKSGRRGNGRSKA